MLADDNSRKRYSGVLLIESVVYLGLFALLFGIDPVLLHDRLLKPAFNCKSVIATN